MAVHTNPVSNKEDGKFELREELLNDSHFRIKKSLQEFTTPGLPLLQRINKMWNFNNNTKRKHSNHNDNNKKLDKYSKIVNVTEKIKAKEAIYPNTLIDDNDSEPEFEWDYLDELQQDLADDYIFKDSNRKKRFNDNSISSTILKYDDPKFLDFNKKSAQSISNADSKIKNIYTDQENSIDTENVVYKNIESRVYSDLVKHPLMENYNVYSRGVKETDSFKTNKAKTKSDTIIKDYNKHIDYDPTERNVEITLINFGNNLNTEYMKDFEPIHFNTKENLRKSSNDTKYKTGYNFDIAKETNILSKPNAINNYLNSKSVHNDLLYLEGNKDFNNELLKENNNFIVPNDLQEYVKKYSSKTSDATDVKRMNDPMKILKRQRRTSKYG